MMTIRLTKYEDLPGLREVLEGTGLFPAEMLADLASGFLAGDESAGLWLSCESGGQAMGFCYAVPEALTDGTWNMLAIAVLPARQGEGCGCALVARLEAILRDQGQRVLIADTSGTEAFARTRAFYSANGYAEEARIRDFWAEGDDKVVFWKSLR